MAQVAREELNLDKVMFMPSGCPPHKKTDSIADKSHRSNMVKMAIEDNPFFEFSDFELRKDGTIYTVNTLEMLKEQYPEDRFFFIMGADSLLSIESWKMPEKIFTLVTVVVADRAESFVKVIEMINYLKNKYSAEIMFINSPLVNISSSYIRNNVKNNISIKYLVNDRVEKYIYENKLYFD